MRKGIVKWFSEARGYGFIIPDGGGSEVLVHYSGIEKRGFKTLISGERVGFEVREDSRGVACACRVISLGVVDSYYTIEAKAS